MESPCTKTNVIDRCHYSNRNTGTALKRHALKFSASLIGIVAKLDVLKNSIDVVGAKAIVEAVKVNAELTTKVAFDFNSIGLDGVDAINTGLQGQYCRDYT